MFKPWHYNELQQIGVNFESQVEVEAYDVKQSSNSPEACKDLLDDLGVADEHVLLEYGTATGNLAIEAAKRCKFAYAVDVSKAMLMFAERKAQRQGIRNISFHHAGFLSYEHSDEHVDFIITRYAFHHLPDFWKMQALQKMTSYLKPGGHLHLKDVVFSFEPENAHSEIEKWISEVTTHSGFSQEEFEMHVREEYSTYAWLLEAMFARAGLKVLTKRYLSPTYAEYLCEKRVSDANH